MNIFALIKDILAPKKCYWCENVGSFLCPKCLEKIQKHENICYVCKQKSRNFEVHDYCKNKKIFYDRIIILFHYKTDIIKKLIKNLKFYSKKEIALDFLDLINLELINYDKSKIILIPTPMFWYKKLLRWYNQSEVIIKYLSQKYDYKYDFWLIKKVKSTKPQSHLSKMQRISNLQNCYKIDKNLLNIYKNYHFFIVDDVVSTATTFNEIAKILKQNNIKEVSCLSIASD